MRLPEIAEELRTIAVDERMPQDLSIKIADCAASISRRPARMRRPAQSATITPQLYDDIRAYYEANKNMTQTAIAAHFNINQGRVSEALRGKRY